MEQHDFLQGSPDWHKHRASHFNASDAPAMLGISQYKTRNQLLHEMAIGITQEIDAATQRRFDDGHRFEALARPLAEQIIGKKFYPVIGSEGKLSASFDGLTADDSAAFEHKTLNNSLREALSAGEIPEQYRAQMEQQLMLSGAGRCIFMASSWNDADELIEEMHQWYDSDQDMRDRLLQGWTQFAIDLENYQPVEQVEKPVAEVIMSLPALAVQATGMVTNSNLPQFKAAAESYIANINTDLQTDEDFVNAEATVKFCKQTEDTLEVTKKSILAQTATIDEVIRTVDYIQAQLRDKRLMLDKLVRSEKESIRRQIGMAAASAFETHRLALEAEIAPLKLLATPPDINEAMKNKRTLSSMHNAVDTALAEAKIAADAMAKDIRAKLTWCKDSSAGFGFLFSDLAGLIANNGMEAFQAIVNGRIANHKADEAAKEEATRIRIQAEEKAKAEDRAKMIEQNAQPTASVSPIKPRPNDAAIIRAIIKEFSCTNGQACDYILAVAENLRMAA